MKLPLGTIYCVKLPPETIHREPYPCKTARFEPVRRTSTGRWKMSGSLVNVLGVTSFECLLCSLDSRSLRAFTCKWLLATCHQKVHIKFSVSMWTLLVVQMIVTKVSRLDCLFLYSKEAFGNLTTKRRLGALPCKFQATVNDWELFTNVFWVQICESQLMREKFSTRNSVNEWAREHWKLKGSWLKKRKNFSSQSTN